MKKLATGIAVMLLLVCGGLAHAEALHIFSNVTGSEAKGTAYIGVNRARVIGAHVAFGNATGAVDFYQSINGTNWHKFKTYSTVAQSGVYDIKTLAPVACHIKMVYRQKYAMPYDNETGVSLLKPANLWINYERD